MSFVTSAFFVFGAIVFVIYHMVSGNLRIGKAVASPAETEPAAQVNRPDKRAINQYGYVVLFAANLVFYGFVGIRVLPVLLTCMVWTYVGGLLVGRAKEADGEAPHGASSAMQVQKNSSDSVDSNGQKNTNPGFTPKEIWLYRFFWFGALVFLAFFKIGDLVTRGVSQTMLDGASDPALRILLPVGMSFYVFTCCNYLTEIHRGKIEAERTFLRFGAFVSFFPSLLSGPILRGREILVQLQHPKKPSAEQLTHGFWLFLWGMFVKLFVANRLSPAVDYIFNQAGFYTGIYYLTAAILFALQLYADFASYSDMAIGIAGMLGIDVPRNFNNPFLSVNLAELWNRWHVSLNNWFIDNVYIPLGGSRKGKTRKYLNAFVIFALSGLWHGQGLHFLVWGLYNGILMIIGQLTEPWRAKLRTRLHLENSAVLRWIRRLIVFLIFSMTFIFFRADTTDTGVMMTKGILGIRPSDLAGFYPQQMFGKDNAQFLAAALLTLAFLCVQYLRRDEKVLTGKNSLGSKRTLEEKRASADQSTAAGESQQVLNSIPGEENSLVEKSTVAGIRPLASENLTCSDANLARARRIPQAVQILVAAGLIAACVFALCASATTLNTQFVYYNF